MPVLDIPPSGPSPLNPSVCDPWIISNDLCCNTEGVTGETIDRMIMAATEVYWGLSGRQFGVCTVPPLRPCRRDCWDGHGIEWVGGNPFVTGWGYPGWQSRGPLWLGLMCGSCVGDCSCTTVEEALLPSPVAEVVEVKIDGAVLESTKYRVDNWRLLVRTDGLTWPRCQSMGLADTAVGTWSVTVKVGKAVPILGELAVGELACELIKGCSEPNECAVPAHLLARTRAGVAESFVDLADLIKYKLTGFPAGDYFLRTFNPSGLSSRSSVHSPDYTPARRAGT